MDGLRKSHSAERPRGIEAAYEMPTAAERLPDRPGKWGGRGIGPISQQILSTPKGSGFLLIFIINGDAILISPISSGERVIVGWEALGSGRSGPAAVRALLGT